MSKVKEKKILILSYDASISGAPIFLYNLSRKLIEEQKIKMNFLFIKGGPLANKFSSLGESFFMSSLNNTKSKFLRLLIRFLPLYKIHKIYLKTKLYLFRPDLVISNTIGNSNSFSFIKGNNLKVITIVHEKRGVIELFDLLKLSNFQKVIKRTDKFVAVSKTVKDDLVEIYNINKNKITVIYNSLPKFKKITIDSKEIEEWKNKNNIPLNSFLVGSCGGPIWRKGPDNFLNIVKSASKNFPKQNIFFIWQGGQENTSYYLDFQNEIRLHELEKKVVIIPNTRNVHFFYNSIDIFISTAREEPFGLLF